MSSPVPLCQIVTYLLVQFRTESVTSQRMQCQLWTASYDVYRATCQTRRLSCIVCTHLTAPGPPAVDLQIVISYKMRLLSVADKGNIPGALLGFGSRLRLFLYAHAPETTGRNPLAFGETRRCLCLVRGAGPSRSLGQYQKTMQRRWSALVHGETVEEK